MIPWKSKDGEKNKDIRIFALSTCGWCRKTKQYFDELGVEYHYVDVDLLSGEELAEVEQEVKKWNPIESYPTIVIGQSETVLGYNKDKIEEVLEI